MEKLNILVLEDDKLAQKVMSAHLAGHNIDLAGDLKTALKKIESVKYDIGFFDLMLGPDDDYSGLKAIAAAAARGVFCVVVSSSDSDETIDRAYALGANDFYAKGNEESNVADILRKFIQNRKAAGAKDIFSSAFITCDPETKAAASEALKYAPTELPILILGPSGTGKTSLAKILHEHSGREGAFVSINCSAYTEDLLEAEMFGHKKGAFTGAHETRKGRLLEAHKGTLFLDEIGTMSLGMQMKLLKAIEERSFYPLGSEKPEHSEFRIISATLEDPQTLIAQGKMRFDLFQRVHGYTINLKPLSRRACDIAPLVQHFTSGRRRLSFTPEARAYMETYSWTGNVRELKKFVDLVSSGSEGRVDINTVAKHLKGREAAQPASAGDGGLYAYAMANGLEAALDKVSGEIITRNLRENEGKKTKTMADLKISTRLLYSTLKKLGIEPEGEKK
ncbi:MAG: sigma-54 dependent transcriptional regulator [Elusimicrobiales bacterium]|nr:sigma-54 dependent transcriptional regulator [Elusimicrobiales bacterium]